MRVAYVLDEVLPNGDTNTEQALSTVAAMSRQGADVVLFVPRRYFRATRDAEALRDHYQVEGNFRVEHLRSVFPGPRVLEKLGHSIRAAACRQLREFDVVHTRNISSMLSLLVAGRRVLYETYRPWARQYPALSRLFRYAMSRRNFVGGVIHSSFARDHYHELGIEQERLEVIHNGYEPSRFEPRLDRASARRALDLPVDRPIVTYVGRVSVGKGLDVVLDIAERVPSAQFLLVGHDGDPVIEQRASELENVTLFGWQRYDALPRFLFAADVLILPPTLGPLQKQGDTVLPMKLFSYLAAGRAILAAEAPDTAELLTHDKNAFLVEADKLEDSVAGLKQLLGDDVLAARLGRAAAATAGDLTWDARAERILQFADRRLGGKRVAKAS